MEPIIIENIKKDIIYWTRDKNGKLIVKKDTSFKHYFFIEDPKGNHKTIYGTKAIKVTSDDPKNIKSLYEEYEKQGKRTYEADVKYTVRYAIDKFKAPWSKVPIRIWYFDIEVANSLDYINTPEPVLSITIYDNFDKKFYSLGYGNTNKRYVYNQGEIYIFDNEKAMLNHFLKLINEKDPDLLVAWNVTYDINYLINRMKKLKLNYERISRLNYIIFNEKKEVVKISGRVAVDLLKLYQKLKSKSSLESTSLENVAKLENLKHRKMKKPELKQENIMNVLMYNKNDVEILLELDKKLGIIEFWDELRRFIGVAWNDFITIDYSIANKQIVDVYLLRLAKEKGIVLPTTRKHKKERYEGALVLEPPVGIFKNVVVLDVKSMYPNIIRTYNLSPETFDVTGEIRTPLGYKFKKEPIGLIPEACSRLFSLRKQFKEEMKKYLKEGNEEKYKEYDNKQTAVKIILNSLYGVMGYENFRLFRKEVAETVTAFGREILKHIIKVVENQGYKVLYGDTDSVFVKFQDDWSKEKCLEKANELINIVNESFNEFVKQWNVDKHYHEIELKFIFSRLMFVGVKKRYAGYFVNEEGEWKEGFEIKGMQIIRSDSNELTKAVLNKILTMLLKEGKSINEVLDYIKKVKSKVYKGEIPLEYLVWKVSYDPNKKYKNENIPHLRGLENAKKLDFIKDKKVVNGKIVWIYTKSKLIDTIAVPEDMIQELKEKLKEKNIKIDYEKVIERSFNNIEKLLKEKLKSSYKLL